MLTFAQQKSRRKPKQLPSARKGARLLASHLALGLLDEALDHVAADVARLTGGQIAVVALLEVDADLP